MNTFLKNYTLETGLTIDDYYDFGKFVGIYTKDIEQFSGHFNWKSPNFIQFCRANGIQPKGTKSIRNQENHFWFYADKPVSKSPKDVAHNFFDI